SPDFAKSREYYEKALQLDPHYARAYEGLADYYGFAFANGLLPPEEKWARLEAQDAEKALALDPSLGEAYNPLAAVKLYWDRNWPAAERDFRTGLELSPNFAEMHQHYALCLILFQRNDEAFVEMQRALELDPLSPRFHFNAGRLHFFARQYGEAVAQYREALEIEPAFAFAHEWLGYAYEAEGMEKEAIAEWGKMLSLQGAEKEAAQIATTAKAKGFAAAVRALAHGNLDRLKAELDKGEYVPASSCALAALRAGEKEQALDWLRKAAGEHNRFALEIAVNPLFDPLRSDPRFQEIVGHIIPGQSVVVRETSPRCLPSSHQAMPIFFDILSREDGEGPH
ncbi:MAG: tetratricopeptide repeat protein, partial [Rhodanobacteraceae bacterium]